MIQPIVKPSLKKKATSVIEILKAIYPEAACSLYYQQDPWKLLVMARLSAQCTDERVNIVSVGLFQEFPTAEAMAKAPLEEIENKIRSCGLYHGKAQSIKAMSQLLVEEYKGHVPNTMEDLLRLPGVGRKIANLILGDLYGLGGIVADTHCIRICGRLGFYSSEKKDPLLTERVMLQYIPKEEQSDFCHRMVMFGRDTCSAQSPKCHNCPLQNHCDFFKNE